MLNKEVEWDPLTRTANIKEKTYALKLHGYYAIDSNEQFKAMCYNHSINEFDSLSFGWCKAEYNTLSNEVVINNKYSKDNAFFLPNEYDSVIEALPEEIKNLQLNVYADSNLSEIIKI